MRQEEVKRLRELHAEHAEHKRQGQDCPAAERVWSAARGELPATQVEELLEHTASCGSCSAAWRLAREMMDDLAGVSEPTSSSVVKPFRWWARKAVWLASAAMILLAIGLQWILPGDQSGAPVFRRSQDLQSIQPLPDDGQTLPRSDFFLSWTPGPEGALYSLDVVTEDLKTVASARNLEKNEYLIPESTLAEISDGSQLFWTVRMQSPDGSRVTSKTFVFRIQP